MIRDLSETLRAILDDKALATSFPELEKAQIVFDPPVEAFNPAQTTVDVFLYDIRENVELRSNEPMVTRFDQQAIIQRPPLRVACSYLITAWPVGGTEPVLQEHQLLSQALQVLSCFPAIPDKFLQGKLKDQKPTLPMMAARSDGLKDPSEFWTALGNKLRPSITVTVTISMEKTEPKAEKVPMVHLHDIILGERVSPKEKTLNPVTRTEGYRIGGRIMAIDGNSAEGASVSVLGTKLSTQTDKKGRYTLGFLTPGKYTLQVQKGGNIKTVPVTIPYANPLAGSSLDIQL
jgi:hypothetical protein